MTAGPHRQAATTMPERPPSVPDLPEGVQVASLNGRAAAAAEKAGLVERLRSTGLPHQDMRDWLEMVDALGELRVLEGVDIVAIKQRYPGHARQAGHVASQCRTGAYLGRITVVVDDDVDITDLDEVIWAICTRSDPARDLDIIHRAWSGPLDPAIEPGKKGFNSRLIIDATRPWEWREKFPPAIGPEPEEKRITRERWDWILK